MWSIQLLGGLRAVSRDRVITRFRTQKDGMLFACLAYDAGRAHPREALIELLWPEHEPHAGRNNLSKALSWLRDALEPPDVPAGSVLAADRATVRLNPAAISTDVRAFESDLQAAERARDSPERARFLAHALEQYRGILLPGAHDDWILGPRQWLGERYLEALRQLIELMEEAGDLHRAIDYARRVVNTDPLREDAHHQLIRLLANAAQPGAALRQYRELERILKQELATAPDAATRELISQIERQVVLRPEGAAEELEPIGGAVALDSGFYVIRPIDAQLRAAIARQDSIVLITGARQMGKSSLLARGLQQAREQGARVVMTDFQKLNAAHLESAETLLLTLSEWLAIQLELKRQPHTVWKARCGPNLNFEQYLRRDVLPSVRSPVVWGMDAVDRLFPYSVGSELFGLFRSWHNERSLDPGGPWSSLTLVMAYATEAHLFISDPNRSPFNVGTRLTLGDFTMEQVAGLNRRYGSPLRNDTEVARFFCLLNGHPYLVQRGLHEMAMHRIAMDDLETRAASATGLFGDHLRRLLASLEQDCGLCDAVREVLRHRPCPTEESFYRLRSAGVLSGETAEDVRLRCPLYEAYLSRRLLTR